MRDPFGQVLTPQQGFGDVLRNQHNGGVSPIQPSSSRPFRARQPSSERSASVIQGSNQILGGGGIRIGTPSQGFMRDVTITGTDGSTAVIQTKVDGGAPDIDPSFTVTAGYNPAVSTEIYKIDTTQESPLFSLIKPSSSNKNYEYEGWLTDGDPLKGLPPLRPTSAQPLNIQVVETEAPKTVTYHNEWQTPGYTPTADFEPYSPPPPASNFDREWKTYQSGQVETVGVIRPTNTLAINVQETEAPKTVTYQNEWFANSATKTASASPSPGSSSSSDETVFPNFAKKNPYTTISPVRPPRPTRPKYRPKDPRPTRRPVATIEEASVNDDSEVPLPTRRPFRNRPTRRPIGRRPTATPEIIRGDVRIRPRPPQAFDPRDEGERHHVNHGRDRPVVLPVIGRPNSDGANNFDKLLQNAVKNNGIADKVDIDDSNIKVSSDGYNGFKEVTDQDNAEQLIKDGGSGSGEYPPFATTPRSSNRTYHSSEYVNEKRWKLNRRPAGGVKDGDVDDDNVIESESDGRESGAAGEIDLNNFFGASTGQDKEHKKRKFETSTRNTFVTTGKPTIINLNLATTSNNDKDDTNDREEGDKNNEFIVTSPIRTVDQQTTSRIRPQSSTSRLSTLSGTVSTRTSPIISSDRPNVFKFPKRPRPDIFNKPSEEEIKDDEVLNKNVEAAIVEQVPEHILSVEDQDPETKCQASCGENEMCHINVFGRTACKCRPGFGKPTNLPDSKCESKWFY